MVRERDDELRARLQLKLGAGWAQHDDGPAIETAVGDDLDALAKKHGLERETGGAAAPAKPKADDAANAGKAEKADKPEEKAKDKDA